MEVFVRRVLLVDDDESVRTALTLLLQREGWEVTTCSSVDEAERDFPLIPCDVVLSDLVMQDGKGGMELLASLRTHDPRIAFVVMSGYLTDDRFKEILQAGASDCLAKPLETDDLVRALTRAIVLRSSVEAGGFDLRRNRILMALDEAYTNAVIHGAQGNRQLTIEIRASFSQHGGVVTVSDPGPGFDPVLVGMMSDEAHRRRGLYLLRAACDDTRWLGRGNVCQMLFRQPMADEFTSKRETTVTNLVPKIRRRVVSSSKLVAVKHSAI
jgi:CheY-like chemotaxis protein